MFNCLVCSILFFVLVFYFVLYQIPADIIFLPLLLRSSKIHDSKLHLAYYYCIFSLFAYFVLVLMWFSLIFGLLFESYASSGHSCKFGIGLEVCELTILYNKTRIPKHYDSFSGWLCAYMRYILCQVLLH